jgi:hypothetical protein
MDMSQPIQEHLLLYQPVTPTLQNSALCTHCVSLCIPMKNGNHSPKQDYLVGLCDDIQCIFCEVETELFKFESISGLKDVKFESISGLKDVKQRWLWNRPSSI